MVGTHGRWRAWIAGYVLIAVVFGLAWWNNPADTGTPEEAQRSWLTLGYCIIGLLVLVPPLAARKEYEIGAQRTLIVALAVFMGLALWWVGFLPDDVFGCSRVDAPDCHTRSETRWRAFAEASVAWLVAIAATKALGRILEHRRSVTDSVGS